MWLIASPKEMGSPRRSCSRLPTGSEGASCEPHACVRATPNTEGVDPPMSTCGCPHIDVGHRESAGPMWMPWEARAPSSSVNTLHRRRWERIFDLACGASVPHPPGMLPKRGMQGGPATCAPGLTAMRCSDSLSLANTYGDRNRSTEGAQAPSPVSGGEPACSPSETPPSAPTAATS